ncbi:MAG: YbhB/YbcL family Raf kinase inhibitor-like protein [Rhizomicrobium sp.]|jgi:Raf kinase inhibitor-like YbhB/YbcL family protein
MKVAILSAVMATLVAGTGAHAMELTSSNVANGALLSTDQVKDSCGGKNISPALSWSDAPAATKSFAVTAFDPDAHGGWWHWAVVNIPASIRSLPASAGSGSGLPAGAVQAENDFGDFGYGGACPPPGSGQHHYEFTVWALPAPSVPLAKDAKAEDVADYLKSHAVAHAGVVGIYER